MKKKILFILLIFVVIIFASFFYIQSNIGNKFDDKLSFLRSAVPAEYRKIIKETIFVFENQKILKKKIKRLEDQLSFQEKLITNILENNKKFIFNFTENFEEFEESHNNHSYNLKLFSNSNLNLMGPRAYLAMDKDFLYLITGTGSLMYTSSRDIEKKTQIDFTKIKTNFLEINEKDFTHDHTTTVKSILIKENNIYVSQVKKQSKDCFVSVVLKAKLDLSNIKFKELFNTNECIKTYSNQAGGNLADFKNNKILFTTGAFKTFEDLSDKRPANERNFPQIEDSYIGKVMSIDTETGIAKVLSMGHRNIQGMFYDKGKNLIYSTEHGPAGGDELNVNYGADTDEIENYGWPIASYGVQPDYWDESKKIYMKKLAPFYKSHIDHGYVEPLIWFTPALGITQIAKNPYNKLLKKDVIYFGAMGWDIEEGDLSVHRLVLNNDGTVFDKSRIPIGDRVRDLLFDINKEKIYLFLENSGSIGILTKK